MNIGSDTTSSLRFSLKRSFMSTMTSLDPFNSPAASKIEALRKMDLEKDMLWRVDLGFLSLTKVCGLCLYEFSSFTKVWL